MGKHKCHIDVIWGERGQEISLNDKLAIIFKGIKVFNRLLRQVFVANPNNYCLPHYFLCMTCHMSGEGVQKFYKNVLMSHMVKGGLKLG